MSTPETMRAWAKGAYDCEAAVELLIRSGLADRTAVAACWTASGFQHEQFLKTVTSSAWSGGERRLMVIAANLLTIDDDGEPLQPVDLGWTMSGLDRRSLQLALAALAHAGGSHQQNDIDESGFPVLGEGYLPPLVDWPA